MKRNLFVLPDGSEIFSGVGAVPAIKSVKYTKAVNSATELDFGAACASTVDVTLIDTVGSFSVGAGDELIYYTVDKDGVRTKVGHFLMEAPSKPSANTYKFTAYDRMILLDKDLTDWLTGLAEWPYTMDTLLQLACEECGLELAVDFELVNGNYPVQRFLRQITGRQLVQWVAGANAAYATITANGKLSFGTYVDAGEFGLTRMSLKVSAFSTAPIVRVVVKQTEDDVGVAWPENSTGETYSVLGNPLLSAFSADELLPYVQNLADRIVGLSYTPGEMKVIDSEGICTPGVFLTVADRNGRNYKVAVFSVSRQGGMSTLKSTGNASRTSASAVADKNQIEILQGRIAEVKISVEEVSTGLAQTKITMDSVKEESSSAVQKVDNITTQVSTVEETVEDIQTEMSVISQKTDSLDISIVRISESVSEKADKSTVQEFTEHFHFAEDGLTISNSATGMGINVSEKQVAFTGGANPTTVITPNEMQTTNLRVGLQLDLGNYSLIPRTNGNLSLRWTGETED